MLNYPEIDPVAFSIGPVAVRWYALSYAAGLMGGWLAARRLAASPALWGPARAPSRQDVDDLVLWCAIGVIAGGRLGYVLFYNLPHYLANPLEILAVRNGGMSFHGGLAGALLATVCLARSRGLPAASLLDLAAVVAPLGLFLGRLANFVNAELWGRVSPALPWGVVFPGAGPFPRHPSQLYEAATEGLLLMAAMALATRAFGFRRPGLLAGLFAVGYSAARAFCETYREPDPQLGYLLGDAEMGLTMGMLLCLPMAVAGVALAARALRRSRPARAEVPDAEPAL